MVPITPSSIDRGESNVHFYNCQEPGHYAPQCPHKQKGKESAVNIITVDVQQVTTRSKAKTTEWEDQDGIRKSTQKWVAKANATSIERMRQDSMPGSTDAVSQVEVDPIWEAIVDWPITLTMSKLLYLVPRFRQAMEARLQTSHRTNPALFTKANLGPTIIDHRNPAIKVLVHGTEIQGCVVDGGSGVNVISKATCTHLSITS